VFRRQNGSGKRQRSWKIPVSNFGTGTTANKNRVAIVLDKSFKDGVVDIKRQGDRIILVKLLVGDLVFNVISAYTPQISLNESIKRQFWEQLDALVSNVSISEKLFI
jgi:hypothetical protein